MNLVHSLRYGDVLGTHLARLNNFRQPLLMQTHLGKPTQKTSSSNISLNLSACRSRRSRSGEQATQNTKLISLLLRFSPSRPLLSIRHWCREPRSLTSKAFNAIPREASTYLAPDEANDNFSAPRSCSAFFVFLLRNYLSN